MMRALLVAPLALLLTAGVGYAVCRAAAWDPHLNELAYAGAIALVATIAGLIPLMLTRHADQGAVAQAGLVATVVHLFVAIALAGVMILVLKLGQPFTYWLFAFYWMTLVVVAVVAVRSVRHAPPVAKAAPKQ